MTKRIHHNRELPIDGTEERVTHTGPKKYKHFEPSVEHMDDMSIIVQALENTGVTIGGSTRFALHSISNEIKRLVKVRAQQRNATEEKRQAEFRLHRQKTGEPHPDDDIPF